MVDTNTKPTRRIIRAPEVCERTGLSISWIYELMSKNLMPKNFKIVPNGRACGWYSDELDSWLENRREEGGYNNG